MRILAGIIIWLTLGIPGIGMAAAFMVTKFPTVTTGRSELSWATPQVIGGPLWTIVSFFESGFAEHGTCFTISSCESLRINKEKK